ncbi:PTS N-acetylgalactosamine transporter subunit IIB [Vibrio mediterranei]|jgi:PTS system N-acetylgalactosamine-specific IIB component|uniref:PTS N-acetylgalactosamine transporter subunit IIB n=1 Tax=Vibrio TaxID=662 RepID=UPI0022844A24|nr:PTS N-acetylgalactosamine transporter subunit IIB [Vibrio mediterranei]MCY9855294.1 PTS N-acetylgalactosamine transporter subunit IIB [Vibrio mediterranei]
MPNIVYTRIDERGLHGQISVGHGPHSGCNLILFANDDVANDPAQQALAKMSAGEFDTRFFTLEKTINIIHKASDKQKIFILIRSPQDALALVKGKVPIFKINIGNMHYKEGKKQIHDTVSVSEDDLNTFRQLIDLGVECTIQRNPSDVPIDIRDFI